MVTEATYSIEFTARELNLTPARVRAVADLLKSGATVPFIARYRKEWTGSLDEVQVAAVRDALARSDALEKRRAAILDSLAERDLLEPELERDLRAAGTLAELEDRYLPFRPKRRTRAAAARERGLEPLARVLLAAAGRGDAATDPAREAERFVDDSAGVASAEEALAGARDIIAEVAAEDPAVRAAARHCYLNRGLLTSRSVKSREREGAKYRDYFDWQEPVSRLASHRVLAVFRGEAEGFLRVRVETPEGEIGRILDSRYVKGRGPAAEQVRAALADGEKRLLAPSLENETRAVLKERADEEAIRVFAGNLRELLLSPPLGAKTVLALDPGFRTGCKLAVLDPQGRTVHHETIQPHASKPERLRAEERVRELVETFRVEAIAVGNGTAGRETEAFIRGLDLPGSPPVVSVNEAGASVYSASEIARRELPDLDITIRGAVSIGRRLQDPLAELVKIDPKSIGVGQYQHDVDQAALRRALDDTVEWAVNRVGVDLNTASPSLLGYVSGLGPALAEKVVAHRDENGPFSSLKGLLKVPRLGPRAFEQAAGFLRVRNGKNPLDASAVHPERYGLVEQMARDVGGTVADLMADASLRGRIDPHRYVRPAARDRPKPADRAGTHGEEAGLPTVLDILAELEKPGRDPRDTFEPLRFAEDVGSLEDLEPGMRLPGVVTNVTGFGAFVDVGVHQDGLVHVSQLADRYVSDPAEIVRVGQRVNVRVLEVDLARRRISLSLRS
ncbi:MAG: Tex family protein [Thermoleophilia bacterium]